MVNVILKQAAERAGITDEQAAALVKRLRIFTHGMANAGDVAIPAFYWSDVDVERFKELFAGWDGLTRGEYNGTRAAVIWRAVCDYLLSDREFHEWEAGHWKHPVEKSDDA